MDKLTKLCQDVVLLWDKYHVLYLNGVKNTLVLALVATAIGCVIGLVCGVLNTIPYTKNDPLPKRFLLKLLRIVIRVYVEVFRGTPMVLQAVFVTIISLLGIKSLIGRNDIRDDFSLVDLREGMPPELLQHMQKVRVASRPLRMRLAEDADIDAPKRKRSFGPPRGDKPGGPRKPGGFKPGGFKPRPPRG